MSLYTGSWIRLKNNVVIKRNGTWAECKPWLYRLVTIYRGRVASYGYLDRHNYTGIVRDGLTGLELGNITKL